MKLALSLLILWLVFLGMRWVGPGFLPAMDLGLAQLIVVPAFLIIVWFFSFYNFRIPRSLILLAAVSVTLTSVYAYSYRIDQSRSFLLARISDDPYEAESRIFRERINSTLESDESTARLGRYFASLASQQEAAELFVESPALGGIVWGDDYWLRVSFPSPGERKIGDILNEEFLTNTLPFTLIMNLPIIGLTYEPERDSVQFIADVLSAMHLRTRDGLEARALEETEFINSASYSATWSSFSHRAFPWWMLGNIYLLNSLRDGGYQPAYLECALEAYTKALGFLRVGDNSELLSAIHNNYAVAIYAKLVFEDRPRFRSVAARHFRQAMETASHPNLYEIEYKNPKVAERNFEALTKLGERIIRDEVN